MLIFFLYSIVVSILLLIGGSDVLELACIGLQEWIFTLGRIL